MTDWLSAALTADHEFDVFDSGQPTLDRWLRGTARTAHAQGSARSWVWTEAGSNRVVPAYLLARLALDRSLHGQGLGSELLVDALSRIVAAADVAEGRLIVVDAIDEAAEGFYARHDFQPVRAARDHAHSRRMVMKVATARRVLSP